MLWGKHSGQALRATQHTLKEELQETQQVAWERWPGPLWPLTCGLLPAELVFKGGMGQLNHVHHPLPAQLGHAVAPQIHQPGGTRAQQRGWGGCGQQLGHRPSVFGQGERACEVGLRFFRQLCYGDCDPLAQTAGVLLCRLSQEDVVGPEAASGGITGEAVKEKHAMGGHDARIAEALGAMQLCQQPSLLCCSGPREDPGEEV